MFHIDRVIELEENLGIVRTKFKKLEKRVEML